MSVDGVNVDGGGGRISTNAGAGPPAVSIWEGFLETDSRARAFVFSNLQINEDGENDPSKVEASALGTIELNVYRLFGKPTARPDAPAVVAATGSKDAKAHGKVVALQQHCVQAGDPIGIPKLNQPAIGNLAIAKEPFLTFVFNYKPIDILRAEAIAGPSSNPVPTNPRRDVPILVEPDDAQ
ncbi:hypothetical protein JAAARDRAFT_497855 [Jaapia argillacea MUCL 33604]|uniref:DUF7918 domain-containing protein n=1 Tax=Jaapia argillacea MUCL 33604 TaxID=933084 RepID=A0A067PN47_9AGAM|nr:hypothetical protein JAAARDRAFT_497855 [Jaapia argillacea MUCL 33604]